MSIKTSRIREDKNDLPALRPHEAERLAELVRTVIATLESEPERFTQDGLAYDGSGKATDVFMNEAKTRDVLGWLLFHGCSVLNDHTVTHKRCLDAADTIGTIVRFNTGRSLIDINDSSGRRMVIEALTGAMETLTNREHAGRP